MDNHYVFDIYPLDRRNAEEVIRNTVGSWKQRDEVDGDIEQKFVGKLGEIVVARILGVCPYVESGWDGGYDLVVCGVKVDVKTAIWRAEGEPKAHRMVHQYLLKRQFDNPDSKAEVYLFTVYWKDEQKLIVVGSIRKSDIMEEWLTTAGNRGCKDDSYIIPAGVLTDFRKMKQFQVDHWSKLE